MWMIEKKPGKSIRKLMSVENEWSDSIDGGKE